MIINADMHIHGRFSRATSKNLDFVNLEKYARQKGLHLLGTGDFTHPQWSKDIKEQFTERDGILYTKTNFPFVLQTEISLIFTDKVLNQGKRIHILILAPSIEVMDQITAKLLEYGRVDYDGRPIFKIQPDEFVNIMREIDKRIEIIPAHVWTPWFGLFGSKSGYDKIEDCFKDQTKHIHALETGLSSDPMMNWQLSTLDRFNLVSSSDCHSFWPWRLGRESTLFNLNELTYDNLIKAHRNINDDNESNKILATLEFWPEEGKYHYDGHRKCNFVSNPEKTKILNDTCPVCNKQLTLGVSYRVNELADRPYGSVSRTAKPFINLISLAELISFALKTSVSSKKVFGIYSNFIKHYGNEYNVLLNASKESLLDFAAKNAVHPTIIKVILENRNFNVFFQPGYDGEYGAVVENNKDSDEYHEKKLNYLRNIDQEMRNNNIYIGFSDSKENIQNNSLSNFIR